VATDWTQSEVEDFVGYVLQLVTQGERVHFDDRRKVVVSGDGLTVTFEVAPVVTIAIP
jgi:hypothetical protein